MPLKMRVSRVELIKDFLFLLSLMASICLSCGIENEAEGRREVTPDEVGGENVTIPSGSIPLKLSRPRGLEGGFGGAWSGKFSGVPLENHGGSSEIMFSDASKPGGLALGVEGGNKGGGGQETGSKFSGNGQFVRSEKLGETLIPGEKLLYDSTTYFSGMEEGGPTSAPSGVPSRSTKSSEEMRRGDEALSSTQKPSSFATVETVGRSGKNDNDHFESGEPNMNLGRKLWPSTGAAGLNLTEGHESILRGEEGEFKSSNRRKERITLNNSGGSEQRGRSLEDERRMIAPLLTRTPIDGSKSGEGGGGESGESRRGESKKKVVEKAVVMGEKFWSDGSRDFESMGDSRSTDGGTRAATFLVPPDEITSKEVPEYIELERSKHNPPILVTTTFLRGKHVDAGRKKISGNFYPDDGDEAVVTRGVLKITPTPDPVKNRQWENYYMDTPEIDEGQRRAMAREEAEAAKAQEEEEEDRRERGGGKGISLDILADIVNKTGGGHGSDFRNTIPSPRYSNNPEPSSRLAQDRMREGGGGGETSGGSRPAESLYYAENSHKNLNGRGGSLAGAGGVAPSGADVISRGHIDSVMYVYFGDKFNDYHKEEVAGRIIQAIGGVVAAIAQVLTVLGAAKCVGRVRNSHPFPVHLHIGFALLLSNLLLLLAVHATEPADVCAAVALILHYLHLVIGCWLFAHTVRTYRVLCRHVATSPNLLSPDAEQDANTESFHLVKHGSLGYSITAWIAPVPFLVMSYATNPNGYETHHYCWMSIEKGMVISFIVPIFLLIGLNTILVILSLRHVLALRKLWEDDCGSEMDDDVWDRRIIRSGIRASAMLLPLLAIMWFLGVVALENSTSIFFQLAASFANIALSWLVLYFLGDDIWPETWCSFGKLGHNGLASSMFFEEAYGIIPSVQPSAHLSFDNEPLLDEGGPRPSTSTSAMSASANSSSVPGSRAGGQEEKEERGGGGGYTRMGLGTIGRKITFTRGKSESSSGGGGSGRRKNSINNNNINNNNVCGSSNGGEGGSKCGKVGGKSGGGKGLEGEAVAAHSSTSFSTSASGSSSRWTGTRKANWSQPGGNEIYELRHDAISTIYNAGNNSNEAEAVEFLRTYNEAYARYANEYTIADWAYNTNLTDENAAASNEAALRLSAFGAEAYAEAAAFDPTNFSYDVKRQLSFVGSASLSDAEMRNLTELISTMGNIYGSGKGCLDPANASSCYYLEPELTEIMGDINTPENIKKLAWYGWHNEIGAQMRPLYLQYKQLKNALAKVNGYTDYGQQLRDRYDDVNYDMTVKTLYDTMLPLYKQLHAYVRFKLSKYYNLNLNTTIPQHLLGDMWGRFWSNTNRIAVPYPDKPSLDVSQQLRAQNYTILRLFETSHEFYKSMGLIPLPDTFYNLSMLDKPADREVVCHATAWDMYDGKDFRIKMCTKIDFEDFLTVHHEMGHIQYFMQYADQPTVYRDGANDGFHEAVGELMSMCVSTPKHLYAIGLLDDLLNDEETTINYLFSQALTTVSTLPFHYLNDLFRWNIFDESLNIPEDEWNKHFWELFRDVVGVTPPNEEIRNETYLDSPTIFHVAQDFDMIRYFTRTILQFQFAESLCEVSGHVGPLYECDFYGSLAAGDKLSAMLKLGASRPWPEALEALTGTPNMDAGAIVNYFKPLENWLVNFNAQNNNPVGW